MSPILAIDPGQAGGIAWLDRDGETHCESMANGMSGQADRLRALVAELPGLVAVMEKTGTYVPGNAGPATATFARHVGNLEAILYVLGIPTEQVAPSVWQRSLGPLPRDKGQRKRAIRELVARRFPHLSVTLKTADALGILIWATDKRLSRLVDWLPSDQQKQTNKTRRYNYANSK
tara:strand:- start:631 stop:1158 length:528 start_codon:yes stop_codon:yes gene_type:complete